MSRNGALTSCPFLTIRMDPACSRTNSRPLPSAALPTNTGAARPATTSRRAIRAWLRLPGETAGEGAGLTDAAGGGAEVEVAGVPDEVERGTAVRGDPGWGVGAMRPIR